MYKTLLIIFLITLLNRFAFGEPRYDMPVFEGGYSRPAEEFQTKQNHTSELIDIAMLILAMSLGAFFLHKRRSRSGIFVLGIGSLFYFGFYKKGCICPIGSIQNIALSLIDPGYSIPVFLIALFILPVFFALIWGRVFCGSVCPLGMIQDIFLFKPLHVSHWLEGGVGLFRFFFLGFAVYAVAEWRKFLICKYDPFVGFFRFGDLSWRVSLGIFILIVSMFIARVYCRFICPYGALLSLFSRYAGRRVHITPDKCIRCTLCDKACPFGAILKPHEEKSISKSMKITLFILSTILLVFIPGASYYVSGQRVSGFILGVWFTLVIDLKLLSIAHTAKREVYEVDSSHCLSCGRCYMFCPEERAKRKQNAITG